MDPFKIIHIAALVIEGTMKIIGWVDHAIKKTAAKDALQNLRDVLTCLGDDIEFYQMLLKTVPRGGAAGSPSLREEAEQDLKVLKDALGDSKSFLDKVVGAHLPKSDPPSEADLATYRLQVERHREKNKRAFKLLWYSLCKDTFMIPPGASVSLASGELADALDSMSSLFHHHPFAVPTVANSKMRPHILNRDRDAIEKYDQLMRRAGKRWVEDRVILKLTQSTVADGGDTDALRAVQVSLFEILWTNTLEQWKVPKQEPSSKPIPARETSSPVPESKMLSVSEPNEPEAESQLASDQGTTDELEKLGRKLQSSIYLAKKPTFTTAFCGTAKAGKSLFLNALIGTSILPSDEFPSTAWPCRVRHVEGQKEPELQYDQTLFLDALKTLQVCKYGTRMKNFTPPVNVDDDISKDQADSMKIWHRWNDLHEKTKYNLEQFEKVGFQLEKSARGTKEVMNLLFQLNDIVRICQRFYQGFGMNSTDWPLLTLEFPALRGRKMRGIFEFIDLPGMGERLQQFETLVHVVAKRSDAIVPIISLKNMHNDDSLETLPRIIERCGLECSTVICTNLDLVDSENRSRHNATVTSAFWPHRSAPPRPGIISCSSLMGISAQALLTLSQNLLPAFETFWDNGKIEHYAAEKILGAGTRAKKTYCSYDYDEWKEGITEQIKKSGLPNATKVLCEDIVVQARPRVMLQELGYVYRDVRNRTSDSSRILEGARRTRADHDTAKKGFERDKKSYGRLLCEWKAEEAADATKLQNKIEQNLQEFEEDANKLTLEALRSVIQKQGAWKRWWLFNRDSVTECSDQVWKLKVNASSLDEFLRLSQDELATSLGKLRIKISPVIENLQQEACQERIGALAARIKATSFEGDILQQQIERNILDQPTSVCSIVRVERGEIKDIVEEEYSFIESIFIPFSFTSEIFARISGAGRATREYFIKTTVRTDTIEEYYRRDIVTPWIEATRKEMNGKAMVNATTVTAGATFDRFLATEEALFRKELEQMAQPMDEESVRRKVIIHGNLIATEAALKEVLDRTKACAPTC